MTHDQEEALTLSDRIAVFNNGFVEQVDKPFNIYNHSKSEFVCDFIGEINHLSGNMAAEMNRQLSCSWMRTKRAIYDWNALDFPLCLVRLEFAGVIRDYDYNGVLTRYRIDAGGCEVRAVHVNDGQPFMAEGDSVKLYIHPSDVYAVLSQEG